MFYSHVLARDYPRDNFVVVLNRIERAESNYLLFIFSIAKFLYTLTINPSLTCFVGICSFNK